MRSSGEPSGRTGGLGRRGLAAAAGALMLVAATVAACGDDDDEGGGGSASQDEVGAEEAAHLLGPEEPVSGEPVRIGMVSDGATDATREAVPGDVLEGISIQSTMALGADDDETFQLYQAVMSTFGQEVEDVRNATSMGGYITMAALATALDGIEGDITPETVVETVKSMPEQDLPGGGGITFQCGGSAAEDLPAVCTNQTLRTQLDAEGQPTDYEAVDASEIMP